MWQGEGGALRFGWRSWSTCAINGANRASAALNTHISSTVPKNPHLRTYFSSCRCLTFSSLPHQSLFISEYHLSQRITCLKMQFRLNQLCSRRRFSPSPHCPYVARDLLSGAVRHHTLALCHMSSLSMDTKAAHSNGDLCCPPGDNAASLKQAGKRRCPSTSIMEVFRVCAVFLSARPNSIGPFPKREL